MGMMKIMGALALILGIFAIPARADAPPSPKVPPELIAFEKSLHKQTGDIAIPEAKATLHLGDRYYFLGASEAREVLTKVWGNPPSVADGVLGIVIEQGETTYGSVWAAVVTYQATGYVTDNDAKTEDYASVLASMREGQEAANIERQKGGYPTINLIGWAQPPSYDERGHSLIWARELKPANAPVNALSYDVRLLGREGVLSLNMLSDMDNLQDVQMAATNFGKSASFNPGATYADYNPSTDKAAGYGLAGLVAAGAGLAVAKKVGLLALVLGFGKKFIVLFLLAGGAIVGLFRRVFGRKEPEWNEASLEDASLEVAGADAAPSGRTGDPA